jgi:hypothetical protein
MSSVVGTVDDQTMLPDQSAISPQPRSASNRSGSGWPSRRVVAVAISAAAATASAIALATWVWVVATRPPCASGLERPFLDLEPELRYVSAALVGLAAVLWVAALRVRRFVVVVAIVAGLLLVPSAYLVWDGVGRVVEIHGQTTDPSCGPGFDF